MGTESFTQTLDVCTTGLNLGLEGAICENTRDLVEEVSFPGTSIGRLREPGSRELWWFQVITVRMEKYQSNLDSIVTLYSPEGAYLIFDDQSGGENDALILDFTLPATGGYFLVASGYSSSTGSYQLMLEGETSP